MNPQTGRSAFCCSGPACGCSGSEEPSGWGRRDFLKVLGLGAGALAFSQLQAIAGPFSRADFERLVPADKKLRPDWVKSLSARGERTVYRGAELEKIGMPIGGLCAGQLYLGGGGRLWHWDIFNQVVRTGAEHYAKPLPASSPVEQGFALRFTSAGKTEERPLDQAHWREVSFIGEYPIGYVDYRDPDLPVSVSLQAFSPFIPLNTEDSSLPATILEFTLKNSGSTEIQAELAGWLENAVCFHSARLRDGLRRNRVVHKNDLLLLECSAEEAPAQASAARPDIAFEDFEGNTYGKWTATGTAFGPGPIEISQMPEYQGSVGGRGKRVVNTHASAPGQTVEQKDAAVGTLTSPAFLIERDFITLLVGGGAAKGKTCIDLLVDGQLVLTATGQQSNRMQPVIWDVRPWAGKSGTLRIVDAATGGWGNIGVDDIVFTDQPARNLGPLAGEADFGTLGLALLQPQPDERGTAAVAGEALPAGVFASLGDGGEPVKRPFKQKLVGAVACRMKLAPGASAKATFVLAWHFPNLKLRNLPSRRHYATRFGSATEVAEYVARNYARLSRETRLWHDTWYDATLPYWFLDRTFLNTSILATSTCYRFEGGRFYGWEGVGCCEGTCGHVWQYAHAVGRLFPDLERTTREEVDFGLAQQPDGAIHFRGEFNRIPAIDAQAGTVLRALREHQMSADDGFLRRNWPHIKRATEWLIAKDGNGDGIIESNQHNTLDTDWYGPVAWLSGLYLAALLAAETMALERNDQEFAQRCRRIFETGRKNMVTHLFEEEYFVNKPDPKHLDAINSGSGCEIDQVFGQSWAFQVGLPRVLPEKETRSALTSLWRYNFTPDVGPYREACKPGRWYAMAGEAGLLMCTFPRSDWGYAQAKGKGPEWAAGYFNECMNGFEYQVAGHMVWEGMLTEGLAITRAVHDRYHAARRNPWNEVECGDHYARSMASYGVFLAACGFEYHGPKGHLGFTPRLLSDPESSGVTRFRAAFTTAEGWGSFSQKSEVKRQTSEIQVKYGKLRLTSLSLPAAASLNSSVRVLLDRAPVDAKFTRSGERVLLAFHNPVEVQAGQTLTLLLE